MTESIVPIGQSESLRLEFKAAEALRRPHRIGRAVVAMLNADGGSVWIGVREEGGRAVELESIPDVQAQSDRLWSSLLDRISPSLRPSEVQVVAVPLSVADDASGLIRIDVAPDSSRRPYGLTKEGEWLFPTRVGAQTRSLAHDELRAMFRAGGPAHGDETPAKLAAELTAARGRGQAVLWLRLQPDRPLRLDLAAVRDGDYLTDPAKTGNRRVGKSFTIAAVLGRELPKPKQGKVTIGREGNFYATVFADGGLLFEAPLTTLYGGGREPELDAEALMEYPTSLFRLCAALLADPLVWGSEAPSAKTELLAVLALFGLGGWKLAPGAARRHVGGWLPPQWVPQSHSYEEQDDFVTQPILRFRLDEVRERPDQCAFRLWCQVYEAFGFWPEDYPPEYDVPSGRLILPG